MLELYDGNELLASYPIGLGSAPDGTKTSEGDGKTPEGIFFVAVKNPKSSFHLSLGLNYPDVEAGKRGLAEGIISQQEYDEIMLANAERRLPPQKTALGGEIYIHGGGHATDWTRGCIALDDEKMTDIFDAVPAGTPVKIIS